MPNPPASVTVASATIARLSIASNAVEMDSFSAPKSVMFSRFAPMEPSALEQPTAMFIVRGSAAAMFIVCSKQRRCSMPVNLV